MTHIFRNAPTPDPYAAYRQKRNFLPTDLRRRVQDFAGSLPNFEAKEIVDLADQIYGWIIEPSQIQINPSEWSIPKDLPGWKETSKDLKSAANSARELLRALKKFEENETARQFIHRFDYYDSWWGTVVSLEKFAPVLAQAAGIKGKPGNRLLSDWKYQAAEMCRRFWLEKTGKEATITFDGDKVSTNNSDYDMKTKATSPFAIWFCQLMEIIGGVSVTECRTLLTQK